MAVKLKLRERLKVEDHEQMLMIEVLSYALRRIKKAEHLVGQFVLMYQLFPPNELGCPIMADTLNEYFKKFAKSSGHDTYDRAKVFRLMVCWGIKSERLWDNGVDTRVYFINPLHRLGELDG